MQKLNDVSVLVNGQSIDPILSVIEFIVVRYGCEVEGGVAWQKGRVAIAHCSIARQHDGQATPSAEIEVQRFVDRFEGGCRPLGLGLGAGWKDDLKMFGLNTFPACNWGAGLLGLCRRRVESRGKEQQNPVLHGRSGG